MRRRRRWSPLVVMLVIVLALLALADFGARRIAEQELAGRVRDAVPTAGDASAEVRSFPFLPRLLASGDVPEVDARVGPVTVEGLRFDFIAVELHGVQLDRDELLGRRRVILERIERGEVRAEVDQAALSEVAGVPITLENGRASVQVKGVTVAANLSVRDGRLIVGGAGISLPALNLNGPLLPCVANAEILAGRVALTCEFTEIPRELIPSVQL